MGSVCCQPCSCALPRYAAVRSRQPNPMAETTAVRAPSAAARSRPASRSARAAAASDHVDSRSRRRVLTFGSTSAVRKGRAGRAYRTPAVGHAVTTDGTGKGPWRRPLTAPHGPTDPTPVMSISWLMPCPPPVPGRGLLWGSLVSCGRLSIGPRPPSPRTGGGNQPPRRLPTCPTSVAHDGNPGVGSLQPAPPMRPPASRLVLPQDQRGVTTAETGRDAHSRRQRLPPRFPLQPVHLGTLHRVAQPQRGKQTPGLYGDHRSEEHTS